jgi:hypothetical protein
MTSLRLAPGRAVHTEDVGDLQGRSPIHDNPGVLQDGGSSSSGPMTSRSKSVATWA